MPDQGLQHAAIDRAQALDAFASYAIRYDETDPKIKLKIDHTYRVAGLCARIAETVPEADPDLAWLAGLLHDIGRFEQVRRYHTFNDGRSVPHALLGTEILFGEDRFIREFVASSTFDETLRFAIAHHADFRVPHADSSQAQTICDILRDADKIDILKVNGDEDVETIYGVSESAMRASAISEHVKRAIKEYRTLERSERATVGDVLVSHICFAFELVYPESRRIALEQGYLMRMLAFPFENPESAQALAEMRADMVAWLSNEV